MPVISRALARLPLTLAALALPGVMGAQGTGTLIVVNKSEATASLIDVARGTTYATLPTGEAPHEISVSPDGRWAVVSNYGSEAAPGNTLTVLDVQEARPSETIHLGAHRRPHGIAWLPDGKHVVVTAEADSALLLVSVEAGEVEAAIPVRQAISHMVALSRDGTRAYVSSIGSGTVTMVDLVGKVPVWTTRVAAGAEGIEVSPDGREVWVACRAANAVSVLDAQTLEALQTLSSEEYPIRVKFTPDGRLALVSNARSSELRIFDAAKRDEVATIKMKVGRAQLRGVNRAEGYINATVPIGIVVSPDGRTAFVANSGVDIVSMVDLKKRGVVGYLLAGREPDGMAYSSLTRRR
jgi:DNA-binding beta-propeller fold protein YncE